MTRFIASGLALLSHLATMRGDHSGLFSATVVTALGMHISNQVGHWQGNEDLFASYAGDGFGFVHPDDAL